MASSQPTLDTASTLVQLAVLAGGPNTVDAFKAAIASCTDNSPAGGRPVRKFELSSKRNEPCPCGSGVKFKKCCLVKQKDLRRL